MQITEKTVSTNGKQTNYRFNNGFYGYVNQHGFTLRGPKGGLINPSAPNYSKAKNLINNSI